jgi:hypothetical protein
MTQPATHRLGKGIKIAAWWRIPRGLNGVKQIASMLKGSKFDDSDSCYAAGA